MVERSDLLDRTYAAIAHPLRRQVLADLRAGPARVTDLADDLPVSLAATSRHIQVLEAAGLVSRTVAWRDHVITLRAGPLVDARDWIEGYRDFWEARIDALDAELRRRRRL